MAKKPATKPAAKAPTKAPAKAEKPSRKVTEHSVHEGRCHQCGSVSNHIHVGV